MPDVREPLCELPEVGFRFGVSFSGIGSALRTGELQFDEVSGLQAEIETVGLVEGGENRFTHRLPGRVTHGNLVLKRGHVADSALLRWFEMSAQGIGVLPVDVTVKLLDEALDPIEQWHFIGAWPVKWSLGALDAKRSGYAIDTLELAYQRFERMAR